MDKKVDAFGEALKDYLDGSLPSYSIRRDDKNIDLLNTEVYFSNYSDWEDYEKDIITKYAFGRTLDIGAGAGRHSIFLQDRDFEIHAIDKSPSAVKIMKIRGVKNVYLMDLKELNFPDNYFDSILMMFTDFGLAGDLREIKRFLKVLYNVATPKGRIIATIRHPYDTNHSEHFIYHERRKKKGAMADKIKMRIEHNGSTGEWFHSLIISPKKLRDLIKDTGWVIFKIVRGEDGFYGVVLKKKYMRLFPLLPNV